jgi:hypothetical protein
MNTADWRWAAQKGFWDPHSRCWNEEMGGMKAYVLQRNERQNLRKTKRSSRKLQEITHAYQGGSNLITTDITSEPSQILLLHSYKRSKHCPSDKLDREICVGRPLTSMGQGRSHACPCDSNILLSFMMRHRWAHLAIRRHWTVGYQPEPIIALFHSLPRRLRSAIAEALDSVQRCSDNVVYEPSEVSEAKDPDKAAYTWDGDDVHGFVCTAFDSLQARVRVAVNARAAALLGMHREELMLRYARRDVPLALPPVDALRAFIHGLHRGACTDEATRYYRIVPPPLANGRSAPPPALVCAVSVRVLASCGHVQEVGSREPLIHTPSHPMSRSA